MFLKTFLFYFLLVLKVRFLLCSGETYFLDEVSKQSVMFRSLDNSANELQFEIADLLGLTGPLNHPREHLSLKKAASQLLLELYNSFNEEEESHSTVSHKRVTRGTLITDDDRTDLEKYNNIITFSGKKRNLLSSTNDSTMTITFNTNHVPEDLKLIRAELRIFQSPKLGQLFDNERNVTASVYEKELNMEIGHIELKWLESFTTTTRYKGWLLANVTTAMSNWLLSGHMSTQHDLVVSTKLSGTGKEELTPEDIGFVDSTGNEEYHPFIVGYFTGPELFNKIQHLRQKRNVNKRKRYIHNGDRQSTLRRMNTSGSYTLPKTCERMNFSIDFTDLEMQDWVIAPKKFEAYFCGGECNFPLGSKMNATNHAIVQTLMHLRQSNLPKPCCVPTVLGSISILHYVNEDSVNLSRFPNSVAKNCGCH